VIPTSMLDIKATDNEWMVKQSFMRLGKYPVTVIAWGYTLLDALRSFEREKYYAEHLRPFDPLEDFALVLWFWAGLLDGTIKALRDFMKFVYDELGE